MNSRIYYDLLRLAGLRTKHGKDYLESRGIPWEWAFEKYGLTWIETQELFDFLRDNYWPDEIQSSGLVNKKEVLISGSRPVGVSRMITSRNRR